MIQLFLILVRWSLSEFELHKYIFWVCWIFLTLLFFPLIPSGVIQAFQSLYNAENNLHENVIQLQREAATVEQRIYGSLKIITKNWEDFCLENRMDARTIVNKVTSTFDNIQPNSDWNEFVRRNQFQLVNEKAKYKTDEDMNYTNQSNDLCIPTKVNFLNRKTAFKKWKEGLYVLTPCKYRIMYVLCGGHIDNHLSFFFLFLKVATCMGLRMLDTLKRPPSLLNSRSSFLKPRSLPLML